MTLNYYLYSRMSKRKKIDRLIFKNLEFFFGLVKRYSFWQPRLKKQCIFLLYRMYLYQNCTPAVAVAHTPTPNTCQDHKVRYFDAN